jgi:hypothetical protein
VISWNVLLNEAQKVFSNILYIRLLPHVENKLGHYEAGFRPGKSTINQTSALQQILEKMKEFRISIHLHFIAFKSAYNCNDREPIFEAMNELNIPEKLIRLVKMTMSIVQSQAKIQSKLSALSTAFTGVGEGASLACLFFNITLENAIRK